MKLGPNQIKSQGVSLGFFFDEIALKSDKIANGKPCIFDELGIKSDEVARG